MNLRSLSFLLFIFILFACSEKEIPAVDEEIPGPKDEVPTEETKDTGFFGQWDFSESLTKSAHSQLADSTNNGTTDLCDIESIIFKQDSTFVLYTHNYALFGSYSIYSGTVTLSINNDVIGEITDVKIAETDSILSGTFNFPNLCVQVANGYKEEEYSEALTYVPDDIFEQYLVDKGYDDKMDDYVITANVSDVRHLGIEATDLGFVDGVYQNLHGDDRFKNRIENLSGIEAFKSLVSLNIVGNKIDSINLSQNRKLESFDANFNELVKVDTRHNPELRWFSIDNNEGAIVDFSHNPKITMLSVPNIGAGSLDLSNNSNITFLDIPNNNLSSIDLSNLTKLETLRIGRNNLTSIDLSNSTNLKTLWIRRNYLSELDLSNSTKLEELDMSWNNLTNIDISNLTNLTILKTNGNELTSIDLSKLTKLKELEVGSNDLTTLDLTNNLGLETLHVMYNKFKSIDISILTNLTELEVGNTDMSCIRVSQSQFNSIPSTWKNPYDVPYSKESCKDN